MTFCPKCGRQRNANARFCGGCGHEFVQQPADSGTASPAESGESIESREPPTAPSPGLTRWDAPVAQTRWDRPLETPETVYAAPAGAGYAPPPYTSPAEPAPVYEYEPPPLPPPGPEVRGPRPRSRMTGVIVIVAVVVVAAAGGGAYAFARSQRHTTQPPSQPTATGQPSTAGPSTSPTATASPSPTASPSASPTPSPTNTGTVQVAAGVASDPAEPQVVAYLNHYFSAINAHNYNAYNSLLDAQEQQGNSRSTFDSGYATTKDSNEVLTGIDDTGGGSVTAHVSFTSQQNAGNSVDGSACNNWQISLYLAPQGNSYVMTAAPAGYHAAYTDC